MTLRTTTRALLPLTCMAVVMVFASQARAACFSNWFGWGTPTTVTTGYAPGYGYYYAPTPAYRTLYAPAVVASYQPVSACGTCGAGAVTSYYVPQPNLLPYRSYRPIYAPACSTCATAYYAPAYYAPAPACGSCGCSSCGCSSGGCSSCGCATGGCSTCGGGCATCGFAPPACSSCGGCASGACGASLAPATSPVYSTAPAAAPTLSYQTPSVSYPVAAAYAAPVQSAPVVRNYSTPTYVGPTYVVPAPSSGGSYSPTYAMPIQPSYSTPTPGPAPEPTPADAAPSLSGPMPGANSSPQNAPSGTPKTYEQPNSPVPAPAKPIPDNRSSTPPNANGSRRAIDPNSRTASSMPMLRPAAHFSTPWPIAKTTGTMMPVVADEANVDADGWHAAR